MSPTSHERFAVLLFSLDPTLRLTRSLLLQRLGCDVETVATTAEFRSRLLARSFDLVILCQSLPSEDCDSAAQFVKEHAPSSRVLLMFTRFGKCSVDNADVLLDAHSGPKTFLETAERMLANAGR